MAAPRRVCSKSIAEGTKGPFSRDPGWRPAGILPITPIRIVGKTHERRGIGLSYKHFLYGAITFTSLLAALLKIGVFGAAVSVPMAFCFIVLHFAFLAWAVGQIWTIRSRRQQLESASDGGTDAPLAGKNRPNDDTLFSAETYLSLGESMDTVCRFVNPKYEDWDPSKKLAFRQSLSALLTERRSQEPGIEPTV